MQDSESEYNEDEHDSESNEDDHLLSDEEPESDSGSEAEASSGEGDGDRCDPAYDYGNLEETGARYKALLEEVGIEVPIKFHEETCGCDLDGATHYFEIANGGGDEDSDSGVEDMDGSDEDIEDEVVVDMEADGSDSSFEDDDEED
jgi:hypothetical protein